MRHDFEVLKEHFFDNVEEIKEGIREKSLANFQDFGKRSS